MSKQKAQIGKGIGALLGNIKEEVKNFERKQVVVHEEAILGSISRILLSEIEINPYQPRKDFDKETLQELANSIKEHDVIQPITVTKIGQKTYQLISGERRFRAAKLAGLKDIPAYIRQAEKKEIMEMALIENLQREDLNAIEIGLSYKQLMDEYAYTQEALADRVHKERSTITNYLRLLKLPPTIQNAVRNGKLSMGHARSILGAEHIDLQLQVFEEVISKDLSVRATENLIKNLKSKKPNSSLNIKNKLQPELKKIEDDLASHFSTKVYLDKKSKGKGSILIEFYSDEDLNRILQAMNL